MLRHPRQSWLLLGSVCLVLALLWQVQEASTAPEPRRRGGGSGGRRGGSSSSSSGGWFSGGSSNKNRGSSYGSSGGKKKYSTLKKAAVIGAVGFGAYQLGKLSGRFSHGGYGGWNHGGRHYGYNDWNSWREVDGMLCRKTQDCSWIDERLYCQDYELDFSPSRAWFGGDFASIVGECACPRGMVWDQRDVYCRQKGFGNGWVALIAIAILVGACVCCAGMAMMARKFMG
jgi:hypothetical protein